MYIKLSRNAYVRNWGTLTYVFDRLTSSDRVFKDAEVFTRWISRHPISVEELIDKIHGEYCDVSRETLAHDVFEFLEQLRHDGIILACENLEKIDSGDRYFSYSGARQRTIAQKIRQSKEEYIKTPEFVLSRYLEDNPTLLHLHVDVTSACTERCAHCYVPQNATAFLPSKNIFDVIDQFRATGGLHITFSGGECMLHPDFCRIMEYAHRKDLTIAVLSNLTLCDDNMVEKLKAVDATIQVSVYSMQGKIHDSITGIVGSWEKTMRSVKRLHDANVPCFIACPVMRHNMDGIRDVVKFAESLNMSAQIDPIIMGRMNGDKSNLACRLDSAQARKVLEDILLHALPADSEYFRLAKCGELATPNELADNHVCGAGIDSLCLDATGQFYPCPGFAGFKLGNCFENTLEWVWSSSPNMRYLRSIKYKDFKKCMQCEDFSYCSICMCRNYNETGDVFKPAEYFCQVAKMNHKILDEKLRLIVDD